MAAAGWKSGSNLFTHYTGRFCSKSCEHLSPGRKVRRRSDVKVTLCGIDPFMDLKRFNHECTPMNTNLLAAIRRKRRKGKRDFVFRFSGRRGGRIVNREARETRERGRLHKDLRSEI